MPTYVALLRGINLGARNKIAMADLRELFAALGCEDVSTYVQSGNVVFRSPVRSAAKLQGGIEERIRADFGLQIRVLVRTSDELATVAEGNPFDPATAHVTFLAEKPPADRTKKLGERTFEPDAFRVTGRQVYLRCPNGYGRSKLSNAFLEKQLAVAATTRNWKTVTALAKLSSA